MNHAEKFDFRKVKRLVVKIGSGALTKANGLNLERIAAVSEQIVQLNERGIEVLLVSSGAMAAGVKKIGLQARPEGIPQRQAVAAVGQASLILEYEKAFHRFHKQVAQILLTGDGLTNRRRYLNARNTLHTLLDWGILPIINENDSVSTVEIQFGDNDNLSAAIALLMDADILINLTDIDGLYDKDPRKHPDASRIPVVEVIKKDIESIAGDLPGTLGTGGMLSKIKAAKKVTTAGIPMIIAGAATPDVLLRLFSGEALGTFFVPKQERMNSRKRWLGYTAKPKGVIRIDRGAAEAVCKRGKSLLPSGIVGVEGEFGVGAPVAFSFDGDGVLGTGLVNYNSSDIRRIMGMRSDQIKACLGHKPYDEVIHRDNLMITGEFE